MLLDIHISENKLLLEPKHLTVVDPEMEAINYHKIPIYICFFNYPSQINVILFENCGLFSHSLLFIFILTFFF